MTQAGSMEELQGWEHLTSEEGKLGGSEPMGSGGWGKLFWHSSALVAQQRVILALSHLLPPSSSTGLGTGRRENSDAHSRGL